VSRPAWIQAIGEALRSSSAEERASALAALPPHTPEGVWIGVLIADASLRVRDVATARLEARSLAQRQALPAPQGPLNANKRERIFGALGRDLGFLTVLLAYPRGQHMLGLAPFDRCPLEDGLLAFAKVASAPELRELLPLPVDLAGRGLPLFRGLARRPEGERAAFLEALTWQCTQDLGPDPIELDRAQEALIAWVECLGTLGAATPDFATWLAQGGELRRGPVTHRFAAPSAELIAALAPLTRCFALLLGEASTVTLQRADELQDELRSPLAELRVLAWQRLLSADLADVDALVASLADEAPGVVVALLERVAGRLTPAHAETLRALATHPRAMVREQVARTLASQPLVAALVAAGVDPRSPDASLGILGAQPPELADPALTAYLEVERTPANTARALGLLRDPPGAGWTRWPALLASDSPPVRQAAAACFVRLPRREAEGVRGLWPALREASLAAAVRALVRFGLPSPGGVLEATLLRPDVSGDELDAGLGLLAAEPSWGHQLVAWRFVVGETDTRQRYGTRPLRLRALDALGRLKPDARPADAGSTPGWLTGQDTPIVPAALGALLRQRDPFQVGLALRWATAHGLPPELLDRVGELTHGVLSQLRLGRCARRWRACWARTILRWVLPRRWVSPSGRFRGGAALALLAAQLLDLARVWGLRLAWPEDLRSLRARPAPLGLAARQLYVAQSGAPLDALLADGELADEAVRTAHPDQIEARVLEAFAAGDPAALRWARLRPRSVFAPALFTPLREGADGAREALVALSERGGHSSARELLERLLDVALDEHDPLLLRRTLDACEELDAQDLLPRALPALAWTSEGPRRRLVAALKQAVAAGGDALDHEALGIALRHPVQEVRALGVGLARSLPANVDAFAVVRGAGPGGAPVPTEVAKPWVGLCEDRYRLDMGLALELMLEHPNGEVARRALKLINRQQQTLASKALFERVGDPELRAPIQATFSRWAAGHFDEAVQADPELLEEARRTLRQELLVLAEGHPDDVALEAALESPLPLVRAAAHYAIGRLVMEEQAPRIAAGLADEDPAVQRAAAWAAAALPPEPEWLEPLRRLAQAPLAELRLAARTALLTQLGGGAESAGERDALLSDRSPEVRVLLLRRGAHTGDLELGARLGDPDPRVRVAVLELLAHRPGGEPRTLRGALRDPVPEVRARALAVVRAWSAGAALETELAERLADPALHVQAAALELVSSLGDDTLPSSEAAS